MSRAKRAGAAGLLRTLSLLGLAAIGAACTRKHAADPAGGAGVPVAASGDRESPGAASGESPADVARRLQWWQEARFGMLVHWGLYSQDGCFWKGEDGQTEQMMRRLKIPLAEYAKIAGQFNPVKFDADAWARITKDAGMKYLIVTAKHHDGFAMWNSPSSTYNVVVRTPWKRDPFKELAEATRKHGLKLGVYYSLGRDWEDPDVPTRDGYRSNTWDYPDEGKKNFALYFERKVKPQLRELLTQYGPIAMVWFDTAEQITKAQSEEVLQLIHKLQPQCIVNARAGNGLGDYLVQERTIPQQVNPRPWETCMSLNDHWAFHKTDSAWKSAETLVRHLVDVASKGGNFLLGVGPTGEGVIPEAAAQRLTEMGRWMQANGDTIRDTVPCPVATFDWGRCTRRKGVGSATATVYLHVFSLPADGGLVLPRWSPEIVSATLRSSGKKLRIQTGPAGLTITWPATSQLEPISSTIVLEVKEPLAAN
jgi:alpha-L-fucosidase